VAYSAYYIPAAVLLACGALYILEHKSKGAKWVYGISVLALHIFVIIYFLFAELGMETLLLFLLASFALAISVGRLKPKK